MKKLLIAVLLAFVPVLGAPAADTIEVITLQFADPESTALTLRELYGAEGLSVMRAGGKLVVRGQEDQIQAVRDLLRQLDVRPQNVRIDVAFRGEGAAREREASVTGDGNVVVTQDGPQIRFRLKPRLQHQTTTTRQSTTQTLMAMSGRSASLQVGEQVPYVEWLMDYGLRWGMLHSRLQWQQVGSNLVIEPTVIGSGPMIRVRLTPELSGRVDGQPHRIQFARAATEVVVRDGESIQIGGLKKDDEFYSRFLIGARSQTDRSTLDVVLTPRIMP